MKIRARATLCWLSVDGKDGAEWPCHLRKSHRQPSEVISSAGSATKEGGRRQSHCSGCKENCAVAQVHETLNRRVDACGECPRFPNLGTAQVRRTYSVCHLV